VSVDELRQELGTWLDLGEFDSVRAAQILADADTGLKWMDSLGLLGYGSVDQRQVLAIRREVRSLAAEGEGAIPLSEVPLVCGASRSFHEHCGEPQEELIVACLRTDPEVHIEEGIIRWRERATDRMQRVVAALRNIGTPAHYKAIAENVNEGLSPEEGVSEHNIHALLQRCERLFVRVGRGTYALAEWAAPAEVSAADAAYEALQKAGRPLRVREIVEWASVAQPLTQAAVTTTLARDERFRHVARDIYALAEWGVPPQSTLVDVICQVLDEAGGPLAPREIVPRVLARRPASPSSVAAVLTRDEHFVRVAPGRYGLAQWGLADDGSVAEAACRVLREASGPLTQGVIAERVSATCYRFQIVLARCGGVLVKGPTWPSRPSMSLSQ